MQIRYLCECNPLSLARNIATETAVATLAKDAGGSGQSVDPHTVANYLDALERAMVVENQPAWTVRLRSRATLRQAPKRQWGAFEIKLGHGRIDEGAASLLKFAKSIDTEVVGEPNFLAVVVPSGYGYTRPDGISIVPATALGP